MRQKSLTFSSDKRTRSHDHSWTIPGASSFQRIGRSVPSRKKHDSRLATTTTSSSSSKKKSKISVRIVQYQSNAGSKLEANHQQKQQQQVVPEEEQEAQRDPPPPPPPPMKKNSRFDKYWNMHDQRGLSDSAVRTAIPRDGLDASNWDLDSDKNYEEQQQQQQHKEETRQINSDNNLKAAYPPPIITVERASSAVNGENIRNVSPLRDAGRHTKEFKRCSTAPPLRDDLRQPKESRQSRVSDINSGRDAAAPPFADSAPSPLVRTTNSMFEKLYQSDGQEASIWDMFLGKKVKNQTPKSLERRDNKNKSSLARAGSSAPTPMKEDSRFQKYWKMKMFGVPDGAVCNAIRRDGQDDSIWDLDWDKNYESQMMEGQNDSSSSSSSSHKPTARSQGSTHPKALTPYYGNNDRKSPKSHSGASRSTAKPRDIHIGSNTTGKSQENNIMMTWKSQESSCSKRSKKQQRSSSSPPIKEDPRFKKYWKMKMVKLPDGAIRNAMRRDGHDESIWDLDWDRNYEEQMVKLQKSNFRGRRSSGPLPMKKDKRFKKYWKMKTIGIPDGAIRNAMWRDGLDGSILDDESAWERNYESQRISLRVDNERPSNMNDTSASTTGGGERNDVAQNSMVAQQKVRRKKIFWRPIDPGHIKENSLWSMVRSRSMSLLSFDSREFNELFIESVDNPNEQQRNKKKPLSATPAKPQIKRAVHLIDVKRSMNGGIVLARLRMEYEKIATIVGNMEHGQLDEMQLKALKDFLPTDEERQRLQMHMGRASSEENSDNSTAFSCLSECEKYMFTMMHVPNAQNKLDCMLFREQFHSRFNDLITSIQTLDRACDEVKNSEKLREILGIILIIVNRMNTGDVGNRAAGFSLEALLKLNETKAFDKKTSVLHYLVKLVKRNNESLLEFYDDLGNVGQAKNIVVDSLFTEIKELKQELVQVHKTAQKHTNQLSGEESFFTLKRIMQQITPVRTVSGISHYNQTDHITEGMCPMERFAVNAAVSTETAFIMTQAVKRKYISLLEYLGEVEEMASNDCFGTIERFITEFRRATEQVKKEKNAMTHKLKKAANAAKYMFSSSGKVELVSNVDEIAERNDPAMDERSSTGSEK